MKIRTLCAVFLASIVTFAASTYAEERLEDFTKNLASDIKPSTEKALRLTIKNGDHKNNDYSFTILLEKNQSQPRIISKVLNKNNKQISTSINELTKSQLKNLYRLEKSSNFWELPERTDRKVADGSSWELEAIENGHYHRTIRDSPIPPYYSFVMDNKNSKLIKDPHTSFQREFRSSDEVGLVLLSLFITLIGPEGASITY